MNGDYRPAIIYEEPSIIRVILSEVRPRSGPTQSKDPYHYSGKIRPAMFGNVCAQPEHIPSNDGTM